VRNIAEAREPAVFHAHPGRVEIGIEKTSAPLRAVQLRPLYRAAAEKVNPVPPEGNSTRPWPAFADSFAGSVLFGPLKPCLPARS
jgi:hypothetical protein